jgi:exosortase A
VNNIKQYFPLFILALIYLFIALTQLPIIENIWQYSFDDGTYSHAYLIPIISIYLYGILFNEGKLQFSDKLNPLCIVIAMICAYALFTFSLAQFPFGYRVTLVLFLTSIIALTFKPTLKVLFPSLFLIFLIPVWGALTPILQKISTEAVTIIMGYTGIPTYVEGNIITIPPGVFEIAGGCSGLRYLLVSLAISSLFIFLNIKKASHGALFLCLAVMGALLTNWIRITGLIVIGNYTNMESSLMADHNSFGWYLYIPFMVSLFYFGQRFVTVSEANTRKSNQQSNQVNTTAVVLTVVLIGACSFLLKLSVPNTVMFSDNMCEKIPASLPLPQLHNQYHACSNKNKEEYIITYSYRANELENSVDFYLNTFTPIDWQVINRTTIEHWNRLQVKQEDANYNIDYQFQTNDNQTTSLPRLKQLKLLNALQGKGGTKLIWKVNKIQ